MWNTITFNYQENGQLLRLLQNEMKPVLHSILVSGLLRIFSSGELRWVSLFVAGDVGRSSSSSWTKHLMARVSILSYIIDLWIIYRIQNILSNIISFKHDNHGSISLDTNLVFKIVSVYRKILLSVITLDWC